MLRTQTNLDDAERTVRFADACAWAELHRFTSEPELHARIDELMRDVLGDRFFAIEWDVTSQDRSPRGDAHMLPVHYGMQEVGLLHLPDSLDMDTAARVEALLLHAATAFVQLRLRHAEKQSLDAYCACVEAMHEGVGLFQEAESEIASARYLDLCASAVKAGAGAVLLRDEFGDASSGLHIESLLGVPEEFVLELRGRDGAWWPETVQGSGVVHMTRDPHSGRFEGLHEGSQNAALTDLVACPLEYQLFPVGLLVLFNLGIAPDERRAKLESLQSLGSLGAVVFHRQAIDRRRS